MPGSGSLDEAGACRRRPEERENIRHDEVAGTDTEHSFMCCFAQAGSPAFLGLCHLKRIRDTFGYETASESERF